MSRDRRATKRAAGYLGEKHGPFLCGFCRFFVKSHRQSFGRRPPHGACTKVMGPIQFYACCNLFKEVG